MKTLLVTADALRADHLGQYGYDRNTIPALDRLSVQGVTYTRAFANGAHTQISIPSLLTSRYNGLKAIEDGPTIASVLRESGVEIGAFHSNTVITNEFDGIDGFDYLEDFTSEQGAMHDANQANALRGRFGRFLGSTLKRLVDAAIEPLKDPLSGSELLERAYGHFYPDKWRHDPTPYADAEQVTTRAIEWIDSNDAEDFFLWIHYMDPHRPYGYSLMNPEYTDEQLSKRRITQLMAKAGTRPADVTEEERELLVDLYDSDLRFLSEHLDRLFNHLVTEGLWDDTQLLFTSDHGEEFGEHGLYYHRNRPFDELIHVPLLHKTSSSTAATCDQQVELVDVGPTIVRNHGIQVPRSFLGQSLEGRDDSHIVSAAFRDELSIAVREPDWKYILTSSGEEFLYDLVGDPGEQTSVLTGNSAIAADLRSKITADVESFEDDIAAITDDEVDEDTRQRLADLGYLE